MKTRLITLLACAVMTHEVVGKSKTIPLVGLQSGGVITRGDLLKIDGKDGVYIYRATRGEIGKHTYIQRPDTSWPEDEDIIKSIKDVRVLKIPLGMHKLQQIEADSYPNLEEIHLSHDTSFDRLWEWDGYSFKPVSRTLYIATKSSKLAKDVNWNQIYEFRPTQHHDGYLEPRKMSVITTVQIYAPVWLRNKITHNDGDLYAHNNEDFLKMLHPELHYKSRLRSIIHWLVYGDTESLNGYRAPIRGYRIPLEVLERFRKREGKSMFLIPYKSSVSVKHPPIRPAEYIRGVLLPGIVREDGTEIAPLPTVITTNRLFRIKPEPIEIPN